MAKTDLKKVQREAKKIRKMHPNKGNAAVMKEAWSVARGGKVSGIRKKRASKSAYEKAVVEHNKKRDAYEKLAKGPKKRYNKIWQGGQQVAKKRIGAKAKYYAREVHEVRRVGAISYTGGKVKISGTQVEHTKKKLRHEIADQLSWLEVLKSQETTKRGKEQIQKHITAKRAELNRIK